MYWKIFIWKWQMTVQTIHSRNFSEVNASFERISSHFRLDQLKSRQLYATSMYLAVILDRLFIWQTHHSFCWFFNRNQQENQIHTQITNSNTLCATCRIEDHRKSTFSSSIWIRKRISMQKTRRKKLIFY